jgi:hypothetical protein
MDILTTKGPLPIVDLARTVVVEDRPDCLALLVRYEHEGERVRQDAFRHPKQLGQMVPTVDGDVDRVSLSRTVELEDNDGEIVVAEVFRYAGATEAIHRSVHVVLKQPSVVADAVAAQIG